MIAGTKKSPKLLNKRNTVKSTKKRGTVTSSHGKKEANKPDFVYHSQHLTYTSHPQKNTPFGKLTVVNITNNVGEKQLKTLDKSGNPLKTNTKPLNKDEINNIKKGSYVPGLWISV